MLLLTLACTPKDVVEPLDSDPIVEADADTDADADSDSDADADADSDSDSDTDADADTDIPQQVVRFIAMGDGGEGNDDQYANAAAVKELCDAKGCDFILYLGDNFYDDGVDSVDDDQFYSKFEAPYADIEQRFYVVLGNHDYGELSLLEYKVDFEIEYTNYSDKWYLPDRYYTHTHEHVQFYGLDTNELMIWNREDQYDWMWEEVNNSTAMWQIAYGHHPYVSNGRHGSAGEYEGYSWLPIANGATVKEFMDEQLCNRVDMYLCGHDHNRQWLEPQCGVEFIVSGSAAKTTDLEGRGSPTLWEDDTLEGFVWIEITDNVLVGEFYDKNGDMNFTRTITK